MSALSAGAKGLRSQQADEIVPLSERVLVLMSFRFVAAITIGLLQVLLVPNSSAVAQWLVVVLYLLTTSMLSAPVLTARRGLALRTFGLSLLVDGVFLQGERIFGTPVGLDIVIAAYLVAVCLLVSFRTGLKVALWHSLLVFMIRQAALIGSISHPSLEIKDQSEVLAYLAVLWLTVIATAQFASLNERELRRRRYDAESFRLFAVKLAGVERVNDVRQLLLQFCHDEMDVRRAAWISPSEHGFTLDLGLGLDEKAEHETGVFLSELLRSGSATAPPRVVYRLGPDDKWLASLFPDARRLIALPIAAVEGTEWVVLEHQGRGNRLERRVISSASQACVAAGLAASRTAILAQLRRAATTDGLTGVANRRTFDETVAKLRVTPEALPISLFLVDIDHFKSVNDVHGHQMGDTVLQSVAGLIDKSARPDDLVARYGGEEFVVILTNTTSEEAFEVAEGMRIKVHAQKEPLPVTISLGLAQADDGAGLDDLVARADAALYRAKEGGRNQVVVDVPARAFPATTVNLGEISSPR
ncbi:diguanylate cyclase (GGDEF) domain-containing protein [Frankineae bacterium MT45]|nr:diguanylate cyclase (GGDEF) domain-containing protein [Frankineae bacterium MT45]